MEGQAPSAPEMIGVNDLADFLSDNPEPGPDEEVEDQQEGVSEEEPEDDAQEGQQEDSEEDSESEDDPEEDPTTDRTYKIPVQGENGETIEKEVTLQELKDGYMMRARFTQGMQDLSKREKEVTHQLAIKHDEYRDHYLHEAEFARAAVLQLAGLKTPQEMAQLAHEDPAGWVVENQRQQTLSAILGQLDEGIRAEQQKASHAASERMQAQARQMYEYAWSELQKEGVDKDRLAGIYRKACENYGFQMEDFNSVYDPRAVRVLKDNAEMRERLAMLESKAKTVTKQAKDAPRLPDKQALASTERRARELDRKFASGNAKLADLAALLR